MISNSNKKFSGKKRRKKATFTIERQVNPLSKLVGEATSSKIGGKSNEDLKEYNDEVKSRVAWSWNQLGEEERVPEEQIRASSFLVYIITRVYQPMPLHIIVGGLI